MADPTKSVADYYLQQYIHSHQQRYQAMLQMAQLEAQQSFEARLAQQKYLMAQAKSLQTYVGNLEKDLTTYLEDKKGGDTTAADDLAMMRMYIDIQKSKSAQQAQAAERKRKARLGIDTAYDVPSSQAKSITATVTEIEKRQGLASGSTAYGDVVIGEVSKISVDNPGSGAALAAGKQLLSAVEDAAGRGGLSTTYSGEKARIKTAIENQFGISGGMNLPGQQKAAPDWEATVVQDVKAEGKKKLVKETGVAYTGNLSKAQKKLKKLQGEEDPEDEKARKAKEKEEQGATLAILNEAKEHDEYYKLVRELQKDGSIDEEDYALFTDRIEVNGKKGKPVVYTKYEDALASGLMDTLDIPEAEKLLYDPIFMRKSAQIGEARGRLTKTVAKAGEMPRPPSYEAIRQRGRELYDPIRMKGSPHAGQQFTVIGTDGEPITMNVADADAMQEEFEGFLRNNPRVKQDFKLIQEAYGLAPGLKVPGAKADHTDPKYIGYTLHQQWKQGTVKSADQAYAIASKVAGQDDQLRNSIMTHFHAYNLQPTINQFKGIDLEPTSARLADQFLEAFGEEELPVPEEALEGETVEDMFKIRSASKKAKTWDRFKERAFEEELASMGLGPLDKAEKAQLKSWEKLGAFKPQEQYELALLQWRSKGKIDVPLPTAAKFGIEPQAIQVPTLVEGEIVYVTPPKDWTKKWKFDKEAQAYITTEKPVVEEPVVEEKVKAPELPIKPEEEVIDVVGPQIPVGQQFWQAYKPAGKPEDPKFYAYEITGYDGTVPQWTFVSKRGAKDPAKMTSSMVAEANKAYEAALKELE